MRRLYFKTTGNTLKPHHHVRIDKALRLDLHLWRTFIANQEAYCRPFLDFFTSLQAEEINFYTDATRNPELGAGGVCQNSWFCVKWDPVFIQTHEPSIAYLELYAVAIAVLLWIERFSNKRVIIFCDNMSVVFMLNKNTSHCQQCMVLIRLIVFECLMKNVRLYARHVPTAQNTLADLLSRQKYQNSKNWRGKSMR